MILSLKYLRAFYNVVARLALSRRHAALLLPLLWFVVSMNAHATCVVVSPAAQLCQSGAGAAVAFLRTDLHEGSAASSGVPPDSASSTERLLARSGCIRAGSNATKLDVREISAGPVTLAEGTVKVLSVVVDGAAYWYVADGFLKGTCERLSAPARIAPAAMP